MRKYFTAVLVGLAALAAPAGACDVCSVYSFLDAKEPWRGFYAGVFEQYADFSTLVHDGEELENPYDQSIESATTQLYLGYRFTPRLGLQLTIPYLHRDYRRTVEGEHEEPEQHHEATAAAPGVRPTTARHEGEEHEVETESGSAAGLGDVALLLHYRAAERRDAEGSAVWSLFAGVELPTGSTDELQEEAEHHHEHDSTDASAPAVGGHDLALGSGSVDGLLGTSGFWSRGRLFAEGSVQYAWRQEGDFDYRFGDELTWTLEAGGFVALGHRGALALAAQLSGEEKDEDALAGETQTGTDLSSIYAGPALTFSYEERWYGELEVDFPVRQQTAGTQLVPDWRVRAAVTMSF